MRFMGPVDVSVLLRLICVLLVPAGGAGGLMASEPDGLIAGGEPGWSQWRGPRRDGVSNETGLLASWPEDGPRLVWKIDGLGKGWSSPIVVGPSIYVTGDVDDDLAVFSFGLEGRPQWHVTNGKAWKGSYPGARACCAYSDGRLYHLNAHGRVACLDAGSADELWAVNILERFEGGNITWALSECLLVDGDQVIVTPAGKKALMAALDKRTGETVWTTEPLEDDRATYSSPVLLRFGRRRMIVNCSSAHGFGVDADTGRLLWTVPASNPYGTNVSTPVYGSGRVLFMTPYGQLGQQYQLGSEDGGVTAKRRWSSPIDAVTGGAVLADGTLFAAGYRKLKWWLAIDWETGRTKYEFKDLTPGAAIYADKRLYCLDERGAVALLRPESDRIEVAGRFQLIDEPVKDAWAHPVLLDGRLYLRYHDALFCYDVKDTGVLSRK